MSHIWHDLGHAFTHADKGFFYTIRQMTLNPGRVTREYIAGRRKKYFNPFSFLVIIIGIQIITNAVFMPYDQDFGQRGTCSANMPKKYAAMMERGRKYTEFINKRANIVVMISTPFLALVLWLLFKRKNLYYAEHLTAIAFVNGYLQLLTIVVFSPLLYLTKNTGPAQIVYYSMLLTHVLYLGWTYHGFLAYTTRAAYWKTMGAALLTIVLWGAFSMTIGMLYIRYGP